MHIINVSLIVWVAYYTINYFTPLYFIVIFWHALNFITQTIPAYSNYIMIRSGEQFI